ncbi:MAG: FecR domain-containing protein, partial [Anaerolineae bacterium]
AAVLASVAATDGTLYRVDGDAVTPLTVGAEVRSGDKLHTAPGTGAELELDDGSVVEISERAALTLDSGRIGQTVRLARGQVIVQAADQGAGQLHVATGDCDVGVKGTVFTVSRGTRGSRVSVLEGEVEVTQGRANTVLLPGEQLATGTGVEPVDLHEEVAWSRNLDEHLALLEELAGFEHDIAGVMLRGDRHESRLLGLVPRDTAVYIAMPNVGLAVTEARELLEQRVEESEVLRSWWIEEVEPSNVETELDMAFEHLAGLGDTMGDELVVSMQVDADGELATVALLAELADRDGFVSELNEILSDMTPPTGDHAGELDEVLLVDDPLALAPPDAGDVARPGLDAPTGTASGSEAGEPAPADAASAYGASPGLSADVVGPLYVWATDGLLVATPSVAALQEIARAQLDGAASGFVGTPFHARLTQEYGRGIDWLTALDAGSLVDASVASAGAPDGEDVRGALDYLGISDVELVILSQKREDETSARSEATVTFGRPRRGMAAWLAEPAPMGALEYIAPDASAMVAFVVDEPSALLSDVIGLVDILEPGASDELRSSEAQEGLALIDGLASAFGGEVAIALDGPWLPQPGLKIIAEVYDPAALDSAVASAIDKLNDLAATDGGPQVTLTSESAGGRVVYTISSTDLPVELHYLINDGYLVAGPSRALLERAVRYRDSGVNLATSPEFLAKLPADGGMNFSALAYQDLGSAVGQLVGRTGLGSASLTDEQSAALGAASETLASTLAYAYAGDNEITFASTGPAGANALGMSLLGILSGNGSWDLSIAPEADAPDRDAP